MNPLSWSLEKVSDIIRYCPTLLTALLTLGGAALTATGILFTFEPSWELFVVGLWLFGIDCVIMLVCLLWASVAKAQK